MTELSELKASHAVLLTQPGSAEEGIKTLAAAADRFLVVCGTAMTQKTYAGVLKALFTFVAREFPNATCEDLGGKGVEAFGAFLRGEMESRRLSQATVARKLCAVSSFLEFCVNEGLLAKNSLARFERPTLTRTLGEGEFLREDEAKKLLKAASDGLEAARQSSTPTKLSDAWWLALAVRLCLTTGLRVGELLRLRVCDIETTSEDSALLHLHAKGAQRHRPTIPRSLAEELQRYVAFASPLWTQETLVFCGKANPKSIEQKLSLRLQNLGQKVGVAKKITVHVLRATVATTLHNRGVPIVNIQRLLNHKDIKTTTVYVRGANTVTRCDW